MKRMLFLLSLIIILIILPGCENDAITNWDVNIYLKNKTNEIIAFEIDDQTLKVPPGQNYKVTVKCSDLVLSPSQNPNEPQDESSFYLGEDEFDYKLAYINGAAATIDKLLLKERETKIQFYVTYSSDLHRLILVKL